MPSTAATGPALENSDQLDLLGCILLYQHRQDQAIGIHWLSARVRGLLWYYGKLQEEQVGRLVSATFLNTIIQEGASAIKVLVKQAETADDKQAILKEAREIEKRVHLANEVLDKLTNDYQEIESKSGTESINE